MFQWFGRAQIQCRRYACKVQLQFERWFFQCLLNFRLLMFQHNNYDLCMNKWDNCLVRWSSCSPPEAYLEIRAFEACEVDTKSMEMGRLAADILAGHRWVRANDCHDRRPWQPLEIPLNPFGKIDSKTSTNLWKSYEMYLPLALPAMYEMKWIWNVSRYK